MPRSIYHPYESDLLVAHKNTLQIFGCFTLSLKQPYQGASNYATMSTA